MSEASDIPDSNAALFVEHRILIKNLLTRLLNETVGLEFTKADVDMETRFLAYLTNLHQRAGFTDLSRARADVALHGDLLGALVASGADVAKMALQAKIAAKAGIAGKPIKSPQDLLARQKEDGARIEAALRQQHEDTTKAINEEITRMKIDNKGEGVYEFSREQTNDDTMGNGRFDANDSERLAGTLDEGQGSTRDSEVAGNGVPDGSSATVLSESDRRDQHART